MILGRESVVLVEGFHDRAFWKGWLGFLKFVDLGAQAQANGTRVFDPWNRVVAGGQFGYVSPVDRFIRVIPCKGKANVFPEARSRLLDRTISSLLRLVICVDSDTPAEAGPIVGGMTLGHLHKWLTGFDQNAVEAQGDEVHIDGGRTIVSLIRWKSPDPPTDGIPSKDTLERLVCAALVAAHTERGAAVKDWLDRRPVAPAAGSKEYAWSHMAGWYAERGCEAFLSGVWEDPTVALQLKERLLTTGAWQVAQRLAE